MSKFFIAAALGLGLLSAGTAAHAGPAGPRMEVAEIGATHVQYRGGPQHHRHYAPPPRGHHR